MSLSRGDRKNSYFCNVFVNKLLFLYILVLFIFIRQTTNWLCKKTPGLRKVFRNMYFHRSAAITNRHECTILNV